MEITTANSSTDNIFGNSSSYEDFVTDGPDDYYPSWPFEIPTCPKDAVLQILWWFPEHMVETFFYSPTDKALIRYIYPIVVATGIITNSLFLWTLVRIRDMRTTINFYLANLAFADLILIISKAFNIFYKFNWSPDITRLVPWESSASCASITAIAYFGYFSSMSFVTVVSIERFLAICFPLKFRKINNRAHTVKMVAGAWLIALIFTVLVAPNWGKLHRFCVVWPDKYQDRLPVKTSFCGPVIDEWNSVVSILEFVPYIVSLCLNIILYSLIIRRLSKRDISDGGGGDQGKNEQATKVRNAVARMLIINGIIYFICLSPYQFVQVYYFIVRVTGVYYFDNINMQAVAYVGRVLDLVNSSINPIIYSATNARYRKAFVAAITCGSVTAKPTTDKGIKSKTEMTKFTKA